MSAGFSRVCHWKARGRKDGVFLRFWKESPLYQCWSSPIPLDSSCTDTWSQGRLLSASPGVLTPGPHISIWMGLLLVGSLCKAFLFVWLGFRMDFGEIQQLDAAVIVLFQKCVGATWNSLLGCLGHSVGVNLDCEPMRALCGYESSRRIIFPFPPSVKVEVNYRFQHAEVGFLLFFLRV